MILAPDRRASLAALLATLIPCSAARAELHAVWALDDGTKIKADALQHPLAHGNAIFSTNPARIQLFGARNEVVAFQLILVGGDELTPNVRVSLDRIGPLENDATDIAADPDNYLIGRRIELFQQHYIEVDRRSESIPWAPYTSAQPRGLLGPVPDALVPLPNAHEVTVPAHRNQGIWIDVFIPKHAKPATYTGKIAVQVAGKTCPLATCSITVSLEVLPLVLPDEPTAKTMVYFSGSDNDRDCMAARYFDHPWDAPRSQVDALRARHFKLGHRHRVTLFMGHDTEPTAALRARIDGSLFSKAAGYEGPGQHVGQDLYSIHSFGGKLDAGQARRWYDWFARYGPNTTFFLYVFDEPMPDQFAQINATAAHARPVPSFVTARYQAGLDVDIYASPAPEYATADAVRARAANKQVWIYNGVRPFTGTFMIDDVAISPRVNAWIQYKYGIPRWFYWEATYYNDSHGDRGQIDVWTNPINFANADGDKLNGDGLLFYPGRDLLFPQHDHGINAPLPSIRLKNWRRGLQDVEYLVLARARGHAAEVDRLLNTMIPTALADQTDPEAPVSWPEDGDKWLRARRLLATLAIGANPPPFDIASLAAAPEPLWKRIKRSLKHILRRAGAAHLLAAGGGCAAFIALLIVTRRRQSRRKARQP